MEILDNKDDAFQKTENEGIINKLLEDGLVIAKGGQGGEIAENWPIMAFLERV